MKKDWDCLDYILIGLPMIVTTWAIWYNPGEGSVILLNIELIVTVIAGGITLLGILLKHFLYDRKQYKDILRRLGSFEHIALEARIGDTGKTGDLTSQNEYIRSIIGNTQSKGDLTSQHDIMQHKPTTPVCVHHGRGWRFPEANKKGQPS